MHAKSTRQAAFSAASKGKTLRKALLCGSAIVAMSTGLATSNAWAINCATGGAVAPGLFSSLLIRVF